MGYRNELKICYANDEDVIHYLKVARTSCNNTNVSLQPYGSSYCKNALQAHKEVLAAASPFLAEILEVSCDCDTTISFSDYTFNQLKLLLDYIYTGEIQASRAMMDEFEDCLKDLRILGTHSYVSVDAESAEENLSAFKESISTDYDVSESEVQENPLEKCTVKNKVNKNKKVVLTQNIAKVEEEEIYVELPEEFNEDEATTSKWEEVYAVPSLDCDVCNITCESYEELRKHQQTHTDKRPYVRPVCQKSFRHLNVLKTHSRVHTGEKPFKCDTCNRAFAHKCTLDEHMNLHSEERPYECTACQRRFKERKSLRSHRCQQDQVEEVFQCEVCGRHPINRKALALHRIHHEAEGKGKEPHEKPFLCDVCARGFRNKYLLKAHQMTHSDEKRFECPVCHKRFSHKKTLQVHSSSHTVNKSSYGCAYCPMSFRYVANLDKHERWHHTECQLCTSTFRQKSGLREHMLTHTREKPFDCETCGKSFAIRRQYVAHRYSHAKQTQRCPVCKKRFYNPLRLAAHITSQHDNIDDLPDPADFASTVTAHMNEDGQLMEMADQDTTEFMDDDSNDATSPTPENDPTLYEEQTTSAVVHNIDLSNTRTLGQTLSEFLMTLEDYTPKISDAATSSYLASAGFEASDPRIARLVSIAAQKFISDIANYALQHCKMRRANTVQSSKNKTKDKRFILTIEDLAPALAEYVIVVPKPPYFS